MALFSTKSHSPFFLTECPNFVKESGCDLMISRRVDGGRCVTQFGPHIKGVAAGAPAKPPARQDCEDEMLKLLCSLLPWQEDGENRRAASPES